MSFYCFVGKMTDARYWSKKVVSNFIDIYKSYPCLWKIKSRDYTNRNLKNAAYDKLVEFCKKNKFRSQSGLCSKTD